MALSQPNFWCLFATKDHIFTESSYYIMDITGRKIYSGLVANQKSYDNTLQFDASQLRAGVYILVIELEDTKFSAKFIKQ